MASTSVRAQWQVVASSVLPRPYTITGGALCYENGVLWAGSISLYYSSDRGVTWLQPNNPPLVTFNNITFFDALHGAAGTGNGLYLTSDGGKTWAHQNVPLGGSCNMAIYLGSASTIGALMPFGFYRSQDGGQTWQQTLLYNEAFSLAQASDGTIYTLTGNWTPAQSGTIQVSIDSGQTWNDQGTSVDFDAWTLAADSCNSQRIYLADEQYQAFLSKFSDSISKLELSTDGGKTWSTEQSMEAPFFSGAISNAADAIYAGTMSPSTQGVFRSTDGGATWKSIGGPSVWSDSRTVLAIDNNTVFALDNAGNIWATYNSGGDSVLTSGTKPVSVTPDSLFTMDTLLCDTVTRTATVSTSLCSSASILSMRVTGIDSSAYTVGSIFGSSIPVTFHGSNPGTYRAELIFQISDGSFDTIVLAGYANGTQPLALATANASNDTIGGGVDVPITIEGLLHAEHVDLVLHYDPSLDYVGTFDLSGQQLDIPGAQWAGRSELNIPQAQSGVIAGEARFTVFADTTATAHATFDSLTVLSAVSPCEYAEPAPEFVVSTIGLPTGCGTQLISDLMRNGSVPLFAIRPRSVADGWELVSSLDVGECEIKVFDLLGVERSDVSAMISKSVPVPIALPNAPGMYYVHIATQYGIRTLRAIQMGE